MRWGCVGIPRWAINVIRLTTVPDAEEGSTREGACSQMSRAYLYPTKVGNFEIRQEQRGGGIFWVVYGCGERLGRYSNAKVAAEEVAEVARFV